MIKEKDINLHVVFVGAWIKKNNKYLLAKRKSNDPQAGGQWAIPGGKIDNELENNIIENTIKREIKEEVGIEVKNNLKYLGSQSFVRVSGHYVVGLVFLAEYKNGVPKALEDQDEVRWFSKSKIYNLINKNKKLSYLKVGLNKI